MKCYFGDHWVHANLVQFLDRGVLYNGKAITTQYEDTMMFTKEFMRDGRVGVFDNPDDFRPWSSLWRKGGGADPIALPRNIAKDYPVPPGAAFYFVGGRRSLTASLLEYQQRQMVADGQGFRVAACTGIKLKHSFGSSTPVGKMRAKTLTIVCVHNTNTNGRERPTLPLGTDPKNWHEVGEITGAMTFLALGLLLSQNLNAYVTNKQLMTTGFGIGLEDDD